MSTVGSVIAKFKNVPLKELVSTANAGATKLMTSTGALTQAGKDAFIAEKTAIGLSKNSSAQKYCAAFAKKMEQLKQVIATPKKLDVDLLKDSVKNFLKPINSAPIKDNIEKFPESAAFAKKMEQLKQVIAKPKKLDVDFVKDSVKSFLKPINSVSPKNVHIDVNKIGKYAK